MSVPASAPVATAPAEAARPGVSRWAVGVVATLLAVHFALAVGSKFTSSTTADELAHLTAGLSYWQHHDYRLHPENGLLPQRWAALPAWLAGTPFPPIAGNPAWTTSDVWLLGHQLFYESSADHFPRLMAGRAMIALFSVATGLLVFVWSRRLFGEVGGLVSLGFFVFCTDFLAHGALVTSDVCVVFFFLASAGAWWWHLHDERPAIGALSAFTFGLAFVAKYSAVLLLPMLAVMALVRLLHPAPLRIGTRTFTTSIGKAAALVVSGLVHVGAAVFIIWLFCGFRYSAFNPDLPPATQFLRASEAVGQESGLLGALVQFGRQAHLLPESFIYGFAHVVQTAAQRSAFLNGEYRLTGWPTFFLWTFALKTSVAVLLASLLVLGRALIRGWRLPDWRAGLYASTPLLALFVIYWAISLTSHLNIGHRHLLPTYPVLFIALGNLGAWLTARHRLQQGIILGLLGWHAFAAVRITPHTLAYFNELAGGPNQGWRHLVDSSLDWGQDLPGLKSWLERRRDPGPVYLSYFGTGEPDYYGLKVRRLPFAYNFRRPVLAMPLEAGTYCVSATMLQHVYSPIRGSTWTLELEKEFQGLRELEATFVRYSQDDAERASLQQAADADKWGRAIARYELLRFARLCHYLRVREPNENIGYSILIYQLSAEEIAAATGGSLQAWRELIERTIAARS